MADTDLNEAGLGSMQPSLHPPRSAVDSEFRCSDLVALLRIIAQILLCVQRIKGICNANTKRGAPQMLATKSTNVDSFLWQASPGECVGTIGSSPARCAPVVILLSTSFSLVLKNLRLGQVQRQLKDKGTRSLRLETQDLL